MLQLLNTSAALRLLFNVKKITIPQRGLAQLFVLVSSMVEWVVQNKAKADCLVIINPVTFTKQNVQFCSYETIRSCKQNPLLLKSVRMQSLTKK